MLTNEEKQLKIMKDRKKRLKNPEENNREVKKCQWIWKPTKRVKHKYCG